MTYQEQKEELRQTAKQWKQRYAKNKNVFALYPLSKKVSYYSVVYIQRYFYKQGKKFGLLKEFRENGII